MHQKLVKTHRRECACLAASAIVWTVATLRVSAGVVINELMYHPYEPFGTTNETEYIELHNTGTNSEDLSLYRFDNGVTFDFPQGTILLPGAFLVVCENATVFTGAYPTVTNYIGNYGDSLNNGGERVTLSRQENGSWVTVDTVKYIEGGAADGDGQSLELVNPGFARLPDQFYGAWAVSTTPSGTPGVVNSVFDENPRPVVGDVRHDPPLAYSGAVVTVSARIAGYQSDVLPSVVLQYRKDELPQVTWQTTALHDDGAIGDAVGGDGIYSALVPVSGDSPMRDGDLLEFRIVATDTNARTMTAPADNTSGDGVSGPYSYLCPFGEDQDDDGEYQTYHILMTRLNRNTLETRGNGSNVLLDSTFISSDGKIRYNCGVRYRGYGSRYSPYNFRVEFPRGEKFEGYQEINLNHQEPVLQFLGMDTIRRSGGGNVAPDVQLCRLWLNDTLKSDQAHNLGGGRVYVRVEKVGRDFIAKHYPDNTGNIYRGERNGSLDLRPTLSDYYGSYRTETNNPFTIWHSLSNLCWTLAQDTSLYPQILTNRVNVAQWARHYAVQVAMENSEGGLVCARSTTGDDYYMYADPQDGQFDLVPWDCDTVFDDAGPGVSMTRSIWEFESNGGNAATVVRKFLLSPPIAPLYVGNLLDVVNTVIDPASMNDAFDRAGTAISDTYRQKLLGDIARRRSSILSQINTNLTVSVEGAVQEGPRVSVVTTSRVSLSGGGPQAFTTRIRVNGFDADWRTRTGDWSTRDALTLTGGVNELVVEALDGSEAVLKRTRHYVILQTSTEDKGGSIATDTVWGDGAGVVRVTSDVTITSGARLTIRPGTVVTFSPDAAIRVESGTLDIGEPSGGRVYLFPGNGASAWSLDAGGAGSSITSRNVIAASGRVVATNGARVLLEDCELREYAGADGIVSATNAQSVTMRRCRVADYASTRFTRTPIVIDESLFERMSATGIDITGGSSTIRRTTVRDATAASANGIGFAEGAMGVVTNCLIHDLRGSGVIAGMAPQSNELDRISVCASLIHHCAVGLDTGASSVFDNENNTVVDCGIGIRSDESLGVELLVRNTYLPGVPLLVRVDLRDSTGSMARDVWNAVAVLESSSAGIVLSTNRVALYNGRGSALVTITGSGSFELRATVGKRSATRVLNSLQGSPVGEVSGTLTGTETRWNGIIHVTGDLLVPAGHTLTLDPGTLVLLDGVASGNGGTDINIRGSIQSLGTELQPVTFTAYTPGLNWGQLYHTNALPSQYRYTNITGANRSPGIGHSGTGPTIRSRNSAIVFEFANLTDNAGKIMMADGSDITFRNSLLARSVMGPEIGSTALLFEDSWITDMHWNDDGDGIYIHSQSAGQDVTLRGGVIAVTDDDGIDTLGSTVHVEDFVIRDANDKGLSVYGGETLLTRCLFIGNAKSNEDGTPSSVSAKGTAGSTVTVRMQHTTVVSTPLSDDIGIQGRNKYGPTDVTIRYFVTNCIVLATDAVQTDYDEADIHIDYSLVSEPWPGTGNINTDPLFVNPASHDYRLQSVSPCVDTGDPAAALDPDGSRTDMGALGVVGPAIKGGGSTNLDSIVWDHDTAVAGGATFSFSDVALPGTNVWWGASNINRNPFFRDSDQDDYRLQPTSPAAGSASDGGDMGAVFPAGSAPAAPTGLTLTNSLSLDVNRINLTWQDNSLDETGFDIERSQAGSDWVRIAVVGADTRSYTDDGLLPDTLYAYRVRAVHARGESLYSETATRVTQTESSTQLLIDSLRVTEIMYNPSDSLGDAHEFLELKNVGVVPIDLTGLFFSDGIEFRFAPGATVGPGDFLVLVSDPVAFTNRYPGKEWHGMFQNATGLRNSGERIEIVDARGTRIYTVTYGDGSSLGWYPTTDGDGYSLVPAVPDGDSDNPSSWRPSTNKHGSPGADDPEPLFGTLVINEVLTHADPPLEDAIELYNAGTAAVDIAGWYLSDSSDRMAKYRITNESLLIAPGGYHVFYAGTSFNSNTNDPSCFGISELGEKIYLSSSDGTNLTSFRTFVRFGAADRGVSFGRYRRSDGGVDFVSMRGRTFGVDDPSTLTQFRSGGGLSNTYPRVGPVVINEIMYNPRAGGKEFVELYNSASTNVPLFNMAAPTHTWRFDGAIEYTFPTNTWLNANEHLIVVSVDPTLFREQFGLTNATVKVYGPFEGALANGGESVKLYKPGQQEPGGETPYILVDRIKYDDEAPWPELADNGGPSLERIDPEAYGNDPANWVAVSVGGTPAADNNVARLPSVGFEHTRQEGPEANVSLHVTVELMPPTAQTVTVHYVTGGTASQASDYVAADGALVFWPHETRKTIPLALADDQAAETDETVTLTLTRVSRGVRLGGNRNYTFTIVDNDGATLPAPVINPPGTTLFTGTTFVSITSGVARARIHFTTDGSTPTTEDTLYTLPIALQTSARIKARVFLGRETGGAVASSLFLMQYPRDVPLVDNTGGANPVGLDTATLNGRLVAVGQAAAEVLLYWGPDDGGTVPDDWAHVVGFGTPPEGALSTAVTGLTPETTYYYRFYATNAFGDGWAPASVVFTTLDGRPRITAASGAGGTAFTVVNVPLQSTWRYLDDGSDRGTAWVSPDFDDSTWASGPAELGYGDSDEATPVNGGPVGNRFITTYFRHAFMVEHAADYTNAVVRLRRDDGAVVYLNGKEILRSNMPPGPVTATTTAFANVAGADEDTLWESSVGSNLLINGRNVLAVEIHQNDVTSGDISFELAYVGQGAESDGALDISYDAATVSGDLVTTGGAPTAVFLFWGTNDAGATASGWHHTNALGDRATGTVTNRLTDLQSGHTYYYRFYATNAFGGDWTAPAASFTTLAKTPAIENVCGTGDTDPVSSAATNIVPGAVWRYLDDGSDQGSSWTAPGFDDGGWSSGPAQLGYGGNGETTITSFGTDSGNKFATTYFRHHFNVERAAGVTGLTVRLLRDDGAVVYLNGVEIARDNMPGGAVSFDTFAATVVGGADENTFFTCVYAGNPLVDGNNVLAVELHQISRTSSDTGFDLELVCHRENSQSSSASNITWTTADISGTLVSSGAAPCDVLVYWGRTDGGGDPLAWDNTELLGPQVEGKIVTTLTGLSGGTYFYRYAARNIYGLTLSDCTASFTVPGDLVPLVSHADSWHYREGTHPPQADWMTIDDTELDGTWQIGPGGFGYSTSGTNETVNCGTRLPAMENSYSTLYIRKQFHITESLSADWRLLFSMDWDDGYIAFLDGTNILGSGQYAAAPAEPAFDTLADGNHECSTGNSTPQPPVTNDLGIASAWLGVGTHTLAIVGMNVTTGSSDFIMVPDLWLEEIISSNPPGNIVSGIITTDTVWYASNSPYTVVGDITVATDAALSIEPGVDVRFYPGVTMTIHGRLIADGTPTRNILFTRHAPGTSWERLMFVRAQDSVLRHVVIEYANCEGDHKDYYDDDNDLSTPPPSRAYFQAVVIIACHVDIEYCLFRNLPNDAGTREGDALAVISDDPDVPGKATAYIRNCQFISIGQGIHSRYSYVLVEYCYFTDHHGDNDDIDLYGESVPPPLIRYNRMISPAYDDMINPTRCSAILIGNEIANCNDHGVVLRDRCRPVMINNLIRNCSSAGIAVQNQCNAFLFNNLIVNCSRGVRFFDHDGRWGPPYYLYPGSGKATILNTIIWDCPTPLALADSPYTGDRGSHATVMHCVIEGGQGATSVSANSSLTWGAGNISDDPLFVSSAGGDYRLTGGSPCIDSGTYVIASYSVTNHLGESADILITVTNDYGLTARPLDGDGDGTATFDIGPYEFLLPAADSNGDGVPDGWYADHGLNAADPATGNGNPDGDPADTRSEYVADTDPRDGTSYLRILGIDVLPNGTVDAVHFGPSRTNREYTLQYSGDMTTWFDVTNQVNIRGKGLDQDSQTTPNAPAGCRYYRIEVRIP